MDCFSQIIGLAPADTTCITNLTADNKKSNSGLFVSELEETSSILKVLKGISEAERGVNEFFVTALRSAVAAFREKLFQEIGTRYTIKQPPYTGLIGQNTSNAALSLTGAYAGAVHQMSPLKGGVMKVTKLYLSINEARTVEVTVYKAYVVGGEYHLQGSALATIMVQTASGTATPKELETALELPLTDDSGQPLYYLFLYDRSEGFQPLNNKATCGCDGQRQVERWMSQGGVQGDDLQHLRTNGRSASYVNGVVVQAELKCSDTGFVCESYGANPFIKTAIEHAILYQTASNLIMAILRSDSINRFALTKREQMATDAAILHNKFKSRVPWIAENIDMKPNNCFVCNTLNETSGPYKAMIRL